MKELCVTCKKETKYYRDDHVDYRIGYIEGSGQLCLDCYDDIYLKPERKQNEHYKSNEASRRVHNGLSR